MHHPGKGRYFATPSPLPLPLPHLPQRHPQIPHIPHLTHPPLRALHLLQLPRRHHHKLMRLTRLPPHPHPHLPPNPPAHPPNSPIPQPHTIPNSQRTHHQPPSPRPFLILILIFILIPPFAYSLTHLLFTDYRPRHAPPPPPGHPPEPAESAPAPPLPACTAAVAPSAVPISEIIFCTFELAVPVNSPFARGSSNSDSVTPANAALLKNAAIELAPELANDPSRIYAAEPAPLPVPATPPTTAPADEAVPAAPVPKYPLKIPDAADEEALITVHLASPPSIGNRRAPRLSYP